MPDELYRIIQDRSVSIVEFQMRPGTDTLLFDSVMERISGELAAHGTGGWVLDLSQVNYLNSAGLGMLVNIRFKIRESKGVLALCGMSPRLLELFKSCCLERLFLIVKTRADAVAAVSR